MKLLSPIQYDIPVVGDLIPAVAGIVAGAILLLLDSGKEFPVGECASSALAEAVVRFGIESVVAVQLGYILLPFTDRFSSLKNDRFQAQFDKTQSTK